MLDVGANIVCDAERLVEFAIMGAAFHRAVHGSQRPTVGLLNVGSEDEKGHEEVREANRLLRELGSLDLDYRGFVEGDDIAKGTVDVVVTDGFTGNVALKTAEGLARFFRTELRGTFASDPLARLGALHRPGGAAGAWREQFDPSHDQRRAFPGPERDCGQKPWRRRRARIRHRHPAWRPTSRPATSSPQIDRNLRTDDRRHAEAGRRGPGKIEGVSSTLRSVVTGVGGYLPARIVTNDDLAKIVDTSDEWIVERTGIRQRRRAVEGESDLRPGRRARPRGRWRPPAARRPTST